MVGWVRARVAGHAVLVSSLDRGLAGCWRVGVGCWVLDVGVSVPVSISVLVPVSVSVPVVVAAGVLVARIHLVCRRIKLKAV